MAQILKTDTKTIHRSKSMNACIQIHDLHSYLYAQHTNIFYKWYWDLVVYFYQWLLLYLPLNSLQNVKENTLTFHHQWRWCHWSLSNGFIYLTSHWQ